MENKVYLYAGLTVLLVALDQITKLLVFGTTRNFGFFSIDAVVNTGVSFGLFQGSNIIIIIVSILILFGILYFWKEFKGLEVFISLITAGIIGNLIDRVFLGHVRDFFDLHWWPVFNVADSMLFIGVFGLIIFYIASEIKHRLKHKKSDN